MRCFEDIWIALGHLDNEEGEVLATWKYMLEDEFSVLREALVPTGKHVISNFPCPHWPEYTNCQGMYIFGNYGYCPQVYDENGHRLPLNDEVTIFEEKCDKIYLTEEDTALFTFDVYMFWKILTENENAWKGITYNNCPVKIKYSDSLYEIGTYVGAKSSQYKVFFTHADSMDTIEVLNRRIDTPLILIFAWPYRIPNTVLKRLVDTNPRSMIISLSDIVGYDNNGFVYSLEISEAFEKSWKQYSEYCIKPLDGSLSLSFQETEGSGCRSVTDTNKEEKRLISKNIFHYNASPKSWSIRYGDVPPLDINHEKGLLYIAILLNSPRKEFPSITLKDMAASYFRTKQKRSKKNEQSIREEISEFYEKENSIATNSIYESEDKGENEGEKEPGYQSGYDNSIRIVNDPNQELREGLNKSLLEDIRRLKNDLKTIKISLDEAKKHKDNDAIKRAKKIRNERLEELNIAIGKWTKRTRATKAISTAINRALKKIQEKEHPNLAKYLDENIKISSNLRFIQHNENTTWDVILPSTTSKTDTNQ